MLRLTMLLVAFLLALTGVDAAALARQQASRTSAALLPAGAPMYRATYQYDDGGRRIAQTVEARTVPNGVYVMVHRRCFLYDGWNCVAEFDYAPAGAGATRTLFRSQVWGPSIGGGGAGGLLIVRRHTGPATGTHFATHDGNGNVTALVNAATGSESARYDYDPFGSLLRATGPFAAENPYRFSTQYTDDITGLVYYGYRHYDPVHGRWLSRDPIGEAGGMNLYGFIGNDSVNDTDSLGMVSSKEVQSRALQFHGLLMQLRAQQEYIRKYVDFYGDPRDPNFKKRLCEELQKYQRLHAMLPGPQEALQRMMVELGLQESEGWDIIRWAGFGESTYGPQKAYQDALAELAALTQEGMASGDVLRAAIIGHAAVDSAFLEADMGEIDAQRGVGLTGVALNSGFLAVAAGGGMTAAMGFLGTEAGVAGAKALGASDGVAMAVGIASGLTGGGLSNLLRRGTTGTFNLDAGAITNLAARSRLTSSVVRQMRRDIGGGQLVATRTALRESLGQVRTHGNFIQRWRWMQNYRQIQRIPESVSSRFQITPSRRIGAVDLRACPGL